jgi:hypothetical protein
MSFLFGGGNQTVVEKNTTEPSSVAKPYVQKVLSQADNLYNQGWGTTYYPNSTVTPFSQASQEAMGGMLQQARGGNPAGMNAINSNMAITGNQGISQGILGGLNPAQQVASGQNSITTGGEYGRLANLGMSPTASSGLQGIANGSQLAGQGNVARQFMSAGNGLGGKISTEADYRGELGGLQQPGANEQNLSGMARGDEIGAGNPYISGIADATERRALDQANAMFSAKGRLGANAAFGDTVGRALSESRNQLYAQDYENARARQLGASGMISQEQQGNAGLRQGLLSGITGVQGQNIANKFTNAGMRLGAENQYNQTQAQNAAQRMGAAGQIDSANAQKLQGVLSALGGQTQTQAANIANQVGAGQNIVDAYGQGQQRSLAAQGLSGDLYQNTFAPYERMAQVGSAQEGLQREQTAADIERFNFGQNAPWNNLGKFASLVNGGQYGQTSTTSAPGQSPIQGLLSGAGTGAGIAGALGLTGGWGAGAAGLGGLLGLLSDKRAKEDIEKVGKTEGGHNIYTYRYKGDPVTHMGVLAQEVQKKTPEAA